MANQDEKIEDFRTWLKQREASQSQAISAETKNHDRRALMKTERGELTIIKLEFEKRFPAT